MKFGNIKLDLSQGNSNIWLFQNKTSGAEAETTRKGWGEEVMAGRAVGAG
jgi:hypothetical protein